MGVRIITDSSVDITPGLRERIKAVPLTVRFGEKEYQDGCTISPEIFYEMLASAEELPTTSQPTPAAFEDAFQEAVESGDEVVCITISSRLSGTYQSATIAAEEFPGKVFVVDSRTAAIGAGVLTEYAQGLADKGMTGKEILEELIAARKKIRLYFMVDTLEYLKKGGRLNAAVAVVGGLLNIKPILQINGEGEIGMLSTARGMKKAFSALTELASKEGGPDPEKPALLGFTGGTDENLAKYRAETPELWPESTPQAMIGAAIGVHVGPGAVALAYFCGE